jgi:hypothetical protein
MRRVAAPPAGTVVVVLKLPPGDWMVTLAPVALVMNNCMSFALTPWGKVTQKSVPWLEIPACARGERAKHMRAGRMKYLVKYRIGHRNGMTNLTAKKELSTGWKHE